MLNLNKIVFTKRKSIKRAIARFIMIKNIDINEEDFNTLVRRTQDGGFESGIKYLSTLFNSQMISMKNRKQLLYQFTIEYNTEMYCKQFPKGNAVLERIVLGKKSDEDVEFFKDTLYDIVKSNKIQCKIIESYLS